MLEKTAVENGSAIRSGSGELTYRTCGWKLEEKQTVHAALKRVFQRAGKAPFTRCCPGTKGFVRASRVSHRAIKDRFVVTVLWVECLSFGRLGKRSEKGFRATFVSHE